MHIVPVHIDFQVFCSILFYSRVRSPSLTIRLQDSEQIPKKKTKINVYKYDNWPVTGRRLIKHSLLA